MRIFDKRVPVTDAYSNDISHNGRHEGWLPDLSEIKIEAKQNGWGVVQAALALRSAVRDGNNIYSVREMLRQFPSERLANMGLTAEADFSAEVKGFTSPESGASAPKVYVGPKGILFGTVNDVTPDGDAIHAQWKFIGDSRIPLKVAIEWVKAGLTKETFRTAVDSAVETILMKDKPVAA